MNLLKGQTIYCGGKIGRVMHKCGPHAVKVWTIFERTEQDFFTGKKQTVKGHRAEVWPLRSIQLVLLAHDRFCDCSRCQGQDTGMGAE